MSATPLDFISVLQRLSDLGPPSGIRDQSPGIAAGLLGLDRVLLSSIRGGALVPEALHVSTGPAESLLARLRDTDVQLAYPLIEGEVMRRRRAVIVRASPRDNSARYAFADVLDWAQYAAAPIVLDGQVIGFFQGDSQRRPLDDSDSTALASFAACFALVYERALLRHRLRVQHQEMRQVASWADARTSELGDRSITLVEAEETEPEVPTGHSSARVDEALRDLLTRRELDVLQLMVRGETNVAIARDLVVAPGTVKSHVKNILRKLHAANRAEATSRYLRLTLGHDGHDRRRSAGPSGG